MDRCEVAPIRRSLLTVGRSVAQPAGSVSSHGGSTSILGRFEEPDCIWGARIVTGDGGPVATVLPRSSDCSRVRVFLTGAFTNGRLHGSGRSIDSVGVEHVGQWSHGQREGVGRRTDSDGIEWDGRWAGNQREGFGIEITADGSIKRAGLWQANELVLSCPVPTTHLTAAFSVSVSSLGGSLVDRSPTRVGFVLYVGELNAGRNASEDHGEWRHALTNRLIEKGVYWRGFLECHSMVTCERHYANGFTYRGSFVSGLPHGSGSLQRAGGLAWYAARFERGHTSVNASYRWCEEDSRMLSTIMSVDSLHAQPVVRPRWYESSLSVLPCFVEMCRSARSVLKRNFNAAGPPPRAVWSALLPPPLKMVISHGIPIHAIWSSIAAPKHSADGSLSHTPPFCPEVQPIELLWAKVKRYVADRSTHNRSMTEARQQTEEGFEQITKMFCNSIVKHCHDWIDSFLKTEAAEDLKQCGTLAGVIKHLHLLHIVEKASNVPSPTPIQPTAHAAAASAASPARTLRKRH